MSTWIDFKELRQRLSFGDVLSHYKIEVKVKGDRATGVCPLPEHPARTDGQKRTASFSANLTKGIWQCFGCKASGNGVELASRMEGYDPSDPEQFRRGALKVAEVFGIATGRPAKASVGQTNVAKSAPAAPANITMPPAAAPTKLTPMPVEPSMSATSSPPAAPPSPAAPAVKVVVNEPLNFELKHLDSQHSYLPSRGIAPKAIQHFGLGFCSKGMMADRIAIPLHDLAGKLVGYAGRAIDDAKISDEHPKYRFPGTRERDGVRYEFHKNRLLYNAHRIEKPVADLVVVEGFVSVWWLWQAQYRNVVALMGASCSREQAEATIGLVQPDGRVWAFPDGDAAGVLCAESLLRQISPHRFVRWVKLTEGAQPTHCNMLNLSFLLEGVRKNDG